MRIAFLLLLSLAAAAPAARGQAVGWTAAPALAPESRLWLEGTSNVNRFTCRAEGLTRSVRVGRRSEVWEITGLEEALQRSVLGIPVESLECGDARMDRDLQRTMRADVHPLMTFRLYTYEPLSSTRGQAFTVKAVGALALAGKENVVQVSARVERLSDGRLRIRGSKSLRMTDFGMEPPRALLGLVRARDEVVVRFDFVVDPGTVHEDLEAAR